MSYEAHKVIDKEFEEMINEVCGPKARKLGGRAHSPKGFLGERPKGFLTPDPMYREGFMKWYHDKENDKHSMKITTKCDHCGVEYKVYTEPMDVSVLYNEGTAATSWHEQTAIVEHHRFYCWKCGKPFVVIGSKIKKIESKQLEVVL